ncbi:hypothetical protein [Pseudomonas entomophila]|uniref:Uncharacterized protein n=2 Tax=Pseudomonas entomophila TaxID=312306 RepID=Q1IFC5_PSEE4|nr:hypothetical protein [Pseudomonas entomophila]WMW05536.1 hypothetical protein RAH46_24960 [Pseudomonas entomophila]CAK13629.1 hypothetical protein PSEEN0703 [Pseudomonas entomophila L48]
MDISPKPTASNENETASHPVLKDHSFPVGSIGPEGQELTFWKCNQANTYYDYLPDSDGTTYVRLRDGANIWQDIELPVAANPLIEGRPEYKLGCRYNPERLPGCRLTVFLIKDGGDDGDKIFDAPLGPENKKVTWTTLDAKRIMDVPEHTQKLRVKFTTPTGKGGYILLTEAVMELLLPAFDS